MIARVPESILFLALACVFMWETTSYAFDFYYTPISQVVRLRYLAFSFLGTLGGLVASLGLFVLTN